MSINVRSMSITNKNPLTFNYCIADFPALKRLLYIGTLGLFTNSTLSWNDHVHIDKIIAKANRT